MKVNIPGMNVKTECRQEAAGFTIMELIVAMGLLVVVISAFTAVLNSIRSIETTYGYETKSIVVLNNMIERLEAGKSWNQEKVSEILKDEFTKSDLSDQSGFHPECHVEADKIYAAIIKMNGKPMAKVEFKR